MRVANQAAATFGPVLSDILSINQALAIYMIEPVTKFLEVIAKVPASLLVALLVAVSVTLFAPDPLAQALALDGFRTSYRAVLGPTWLLLASIVGTKIILYFTRGVAGRSALRTRRKQLHELTPEEKGYLAPFIVEEENTIYVDMSDGIAGGLHHKGIIYRASNVFDMLKGVPYNLQPWAREYLAQHPQLLEGAAGRPRSPREHRGMDW